MQFRIVDWTAADLDVLTARVQTLDHGNIASFGPRYELGTVEISLVEPNEQEASQLRAWDPRIAVTVGGKVSFTACTGNPVDPYNCTPHRGGILHALYTSSSGGYWNGSLTVTGWAKRVSTGQTYAISAGHLANGNVCPWNCTYLYSRHNNVHWATFTNNATNNTMYQNGNTSDAARSPVAGNNSTMNRILKSIQNPVSTIYPITSVRSMSNVALGDDVCKSGNGHTGNRFWTCGYVAVKNLNYNVEGPNGVETLVAHISCDCDGLDTSGNGLYPGDSGSPIWWNEKIYSIASAKGGSSIHGFTNAIEVIQSEVGVKWCLNDNCSATAP